MARHWHRDKTGLLVESEIATDSLSGLFYRKDTVDHEMIKDSFYNYADLNIMEDDIVLDLGANIGGFVAYAQKFTDNIIPVEPDEYNCRMIEDNTGLVPYRRAVVPDDYVGDHVEFLINKRSSRSMCSGKTNAKKTKKHISIPVEVIRFSDLMDKYKPTIIKIDIEGGEWGIIDGPIPDFVREIGGELHGYPNEMEECKNHLISQGWQFVQEEYEGMYGKTNLLNFVIKR